MELSKTHNPYDFTNPVFETGLLAGREKEMEEINYYLDNAKTAPRPINIALLGQRASGKTSILNITEIEAKFRGFCTVRINFDEDDARTQLAFFYKLFDSILAEACQCGAFAGIDGKTYDTYLDVVNAHTIPEDKTFCPFSFPLQYAKAMSGGNSNAQVSDRNFRSDLIKLHDELKRPIVLLFDEGNVLAQSRVLLQKLRNVFMNTPGFMLVMTGTPDLFPVMDDVFSPIVRQFKKINVGEFRQVEDTRACIRKPLEKLGINPEEVFDFETYRDVLEIHNLSGGRPYEIQLICHTLFRRVQSKRAETMKLDFSVLEEVRKELETWQDITSRPILTKVRNLKKKQLAALRILCSCNGRATFDQVWSLEYIFNGESSWTKDSLEDVLKLLVNEAILTVNDSLISFTGDDFDKIYTKYLARERGVTLNFSPFSLEQRWRAGLNGFFDLLMEDRLKETLIYSTLPFADILKVVHNMAAQEPEGDVFVDSELLARELYTLMVEYKDLATIPMISINPGLPWLNRQLLFCPINPNDLKALEDGIDLMSSLSERVAELGGNWIIERKELSVVPLASLAEKVKHTANERLRLSLAVFHITMARSAHLEDLDLEKALLHANLSYGYNPEPENILISNDLGYIFLSGDDFDKAEVLIKRAISFSESENSERATFPALPIYNLGVLQAERGLLESACANFQICINLTQSMNLEERACACLWVPVGVDGPLEFEERRDPDLFETAEKAKAAIEYILARSDSS